MWALERKLCANGIGMAFDSVGVICHDFDEQVTEGGYTKAFRLTRNPVDKDGSTAAIVEEGRIHLDITLVFGVSSETILAEAEARQALADTVAGNAGRHAGCGRQHLADAWCRCTPGAELIRLAEDPEARKQFRQLRRRWLPGFALVCRDDLLAQRLSLQATVPTLPGLMPCSTCPASTGGRSPAHRPTPSEKTLSGNPSPGKAGSCPSPWAMARSPTSTRRQREERPRFTHRLSLC
jgi:CRISPR-associated protein Csy2